MEVINGAVRRTKRRWTSEQKFEILKDIGQCPTVKEGIEKHKITDSIYRRWKRQLEVGVRASLRNSKPQKDPHVKRLEEENMRLKEALLNQSLFLTDLKKEMSWD